MCSCRCRCRLSQLLQGWWSCVAWDAPGAGSPIPTLRLAGAGARRVHPISGYVEGQNVIIEYRWALGQYSRLPELAAELVHRPVTVLASTGGEPAAFAAAGA